MSNEVYLLVWLDVRVTQEARDTLRLEPYYCVETVKGLGDPGYWEVFVAGVYAGAVFRLRNKHRETFYEGSYHGRRTGPFDDPNRAIESLLRLWAQCQKPSEPFQ